jgi:hypothetical protein
VICLTWEHVDEAIGASSSLHGHNLPRTARNKRARIPHSRSFQVEDEDVACSADEGEEEDPHDDADFTDSEEAPNGSNDGENDLGENSRSGFATLSPVPLQEQPAVVLLLEGALVS